MRLNKEGVKKYTVMAVLVLWYILMPQTGYESSPDGNALEHAMSILSHANIWHLAANLFALWLVRNRMYLLPSLAIAFIMSFLPVWGIWQIGITMGFSGVLFAVFGIKWGVYCQDSADKSPLCGYEANWRFVTRVLPFAVCGILIPHINWCIHTYCLLAGFVYGRYNRHIG